MTLHLSATPVRQNDSVAATTTGAVIRGLGRGPGRGPDRGLTQAIPRLNTVFVIIVLGLLTVGCRMDMTVKIEVTADGTGQVDAEIVLDPELTAALPPGADLLIVEDARLAGWVIEGPTPTTDGGLRIQMTKATASMEETATAIAEIGPPLAIKALERRAVTGNDRAGNDPVSQDPIAEIVNQFSLSVTVPAGNSTEGFAVFSDPDLTSVLGGLPFEEGLIAAGATPANSLGLLVEITAPGRVTEHSGEMISAEDDRSVVQWQIPLDGSTTEISMTTVQGPSGAAWAGGLSQILVALLVLWVIGSGAFITWVFFARRRRAIARRQRAARRIEQAR